jgi:peptidoglycan/LPS O-acetylase OafA/YrhL
MAFSVPLFIFLSGYSLYSLYGKKDVNVLTFTKKRVLNTIIPYLVWSFIYYNIYTIIGINYTHKLFLRNLVLGKMSYHLYFIPIIIQFYIIFMIIRKIVNTISPYIVISGTIIIFVTYYYKFKNMVTFLHMPFSDRFFMTYLPFFILGIYMSIYSKYINSLIAKINIFIIGILTILFYSIANINYYVKNSPMLLKTPFIWTIYCLITIVFLYIISKEISKYFPKNILVKLSKLTMTVYFCHPIVLLFINKLILNKITVQTQISVVLIKFLITVPVSFIIAYLWETSVKYINNILSNYNKKPEIVN